VIRNAEIQPQQAKHAAGKCLSLPQGEVEHRSQHQHHLDRQIGINRAARPDRTPPGAGMSDRLALANAIEDAGIERSIERVASVIFDAIHDNVATKADVQAGMASLRLKLSQMEHRLTRNGISALVVAVGTIITVLHYWQPHG
jgi:hypothetical protein